MIDDIVLMKDEYFMIVDNKSNIWVVCNNKEWVIKDVQEVSK